METSSTSSHNITSGQHETVWLNTTDRQAFETLTSDIQTDIVVIGGGIAGLTVAYCLVKEGRQVTLLEDGYIGSGESGRTTAHIVNAIDDRYGEIEKTFGEQTARLVAESHTEAIHFIERTIQEENIDCDFIRLDGYLFLHRSDKIKTLEDELAATHRAGIATEMLPAIPGLATHEGPCIKFPGQAQFHPLKYLNGLSKAIVLKGGRIFTTTHVSAMDKHGVEANGFRVSAQHVVVATNTPVNDRVTMHTKQFPYRTYVIGARIPKGVVQPALWWDTGDKDSVWVTMPYHYVRTQPLDDSYDLLICGGEDHKTGQAGKEDVPEEARYQGLEHWLKQRFPMIESIAYRWSGQVMEPVDSLGFIGKNPGDKNVYIVTGDSGNGMTHGTIAGILIKDLILGRENAWEKVYDPSRITFSAAGDFVKEVGNMAAQYLDLLTPGELVPADSLKAGEGAVIRSGIRKIALYRDTSSQLHAYSAICPHLGCCVRWNADEKSFDCPCHGSRFTCEGKVVNGPALTDLKPVRVAAGEEAESNAKITR